LSSVRTVIADDVADELHYPRAARPRASDRRNDAVRLVESGLLTNGDTSCACISSEGNGAKTAARVGIARTKHRIEPLLG
jgi:hypothetical protein